MLKRVGSAVGLSSTSSPNESSGNVLLTFDDGGVSCYTVVADMLEEFGWRGHFFLTTDFIGKAGFVNESQVREIRGRGHVVGTHSCSHPDRMSILPRKEIVREWSDSRAYLSDLIGEDITTGSVPGGYYNRAVAEAAYSAGLETLFTSEPTSRGSRLRDMIVMGRFTIKRNTTDTAVASLASGRKKEYYSQWLLWNAKKAAKLVGGSAYLKARRLFLETTSHGK